MLKSTSFICLHDVADNTGLLSQTVRACNFYLHVLRQLRSSLSREGTSVVCAIIGSRLDYCKSLYYGVLNTNFQRLFIVSVARIVCQAPRRQHHSADLLNDLHWLPVRGRVNYKIPVLCYKAVKL